MFFCHFYKRETTFIVVCFPGGQTPVKMRSSLKGMNLLLGEQFFSLRAGPRYEGKKNDNSRVASPKSIFIYLYMHALSER